jgi:uncharacterized membrane protein YeaQ/YmgE (transglycosylase-associated protein family)
LKTTVPRAKELSGSITLQGAAAMLNVVIWVFLGLGAAGMSRFLRRNAANVGWFGTALLGTAGAVVGGSAAWFLNSTLTIGDITSLVLASVGAVFTLSFGYLTAQPRTSY